MTREMIKELSGYQQEHEFSISTENPTIKRSGRLTNHQAFIARRHVAPMATMRFTDASNRPH